MSNEEVRIKERFNEYNLAIMIIDSAIKSYINYT